MTLLTPPYVEWVGMGLVKSATGRLLPFDILAAPNGDGHSFVKAEAASGGGPNASLYEAVAVADNRQPRSGPN